MELADFNTLSEPFSVSSLSVLVQFELSKNQIMGGGGSASAMNSSIKMNRALAHRKKSLRQKYREYEIANNKDPLSYKGIMSPEDRERFKLHLIRNKRKSFIQIVVVISIMVVTSATLLIWFQSV